MKERKDDFNRDKRRSDANQDPITGAPGSHPVGTGIGAAAGGAAGAAAAGAAMGTAAGPVGTVAGGAIGAVVGGLVGHSVAEKIDPTKEDAYWRENYKNESYYDPTYSYDDYRGAYAVGYEGYGKYGTSGRRFDDLEPKFRKDYEQRYHGSKLGWEKARHAARAAWDRFDGHRLERYIDFDVVDRNDSKIGTLECLWSDQSGEPAFIGVKTGWLLGKTHVVPAESVHVNEQSHRIRLPYDEKMVKDAPSYDSDIEMSVDKEQEVRRYYGLGESKSRMPAMGHETVERREQPRKAQAAAKSPQKPVGQPTPEQATIQLSEEQVKVGKRQVEVGGVRLRKVIRTEIVNHPVELQREELVIERVPASEAHAGRQQSFNEQEVYIPLRREEAVIEKETRLREEVRARKTRTTDQQQVSSEVRREDVEIEETGEARRREKGGVRSDRTPAEEIRERQEQPRSQRRRE